MNGASPLEGRVEICLSGVWGTVNQFFDNQDATVVCRELTRRYGVEAELFSMLPGVPRHSLTRKHLGYHTGVINRRNYYGDRTLTSDDLPIHLESVHCVGVEDRLFDCYWQRAPQYRSHGDDVGVSCILTNSSLLPGELSLHTS